MQDTDISHDQIRASTVRGTDVYDGEGEHIGQIDDIVLTKREGRASYAIMSFGGILGMGEKYHPLPWQSLTYDPTRAGYVVNVARDRLRDAPAYSREEEPDWNDPAYGRQVSGYYGVPFA